MSTAPLLWLVSLLRKAPPELYLELAFPQSHDNG
jgi:hypothetical protein